MINFSCCLVGNCLRGLSLCFFLMVFGDILETLVGALKRRHRIVDSFLCFFLLLWCDFRDLYRFSTEDFVESQVSHRWTVEFSSVPSTNASHTFPGKRFEMSKSPKEHQSTAQNHKIRTTWDPWSMCCFHLWLHTPKNHPLPSVSHPAVSGYDVLMSPDPKEPPMVKMSRFRWLKERLPREMVSLLGLLRDLEIWQVAGNSGSLFLDFGWDFLIEDIYFLFMSRFVRHTDKEHLGMCCACFIFCIHHFNNDIVKTRQPRNYVHSWWQDATSGKRSTTAETSASYGYDNQTSATSGFRRTLFNFSSIDLYWF